MNYIGYCFSFTWAFVLILFRNVNGLPQLNKGIIQNYLNTILSTILIIQIQLMLLFWNGSDLIGAFGKYRILRSLNILEWNTWLIKSGVNPLGYVFYSHIQYSVVLWHWSCMFVIIFFEAARANKDDIITINACDNYRFF